jgi:uncharacterized protein YjiS (DUF1127 family)
MSSYPLGQKSNGPLGRPEEHEMFSLLVEYSAPKVRVPSAAAGSSLWARLGRLIADEYRIRRATREMRALDDRTLRDLGLDRGGVEHAVRFGRA